MIKHHDQWQLWVERVCFGLWSYRVKSSHGGKAWQESAGMVIGTGGRELRTSNASVGEREYPGSREVLKISLLVSSSKALPPKPPQTVPLTGN